MIISIIAAMANNNVIGLNNQLPWHLPADLQHFKKLTLGKPIIMGRKTYESIGRPLPGRHNIVISRDATYQANGCTVVNSITAAIDSATLDKCDEVMIIGGANLYQQSLDQVDRLYLTYIHHDVEGDAHFTQFNTDEWEELEREAHAADTKNNYDYSFVTLQRIHNSTP